jgi:hypothetical protein
MRLRAALCALLFAFATGLASAGSGRWLLVKGENLVVLGQQPAGELRDMAVLLEQFRAAVAIILPSAQHLSVPTNVYIFDTLKDLEPFVPIYKGKPVDVAGYFQGDADAKLHRRRRVGIA